MSSILSDSNLSLALSHHSTSRDVNIKDKRTSNKKLTCYTQFKSDRSYRKKILHTVCVFASFLTMSFAKGQTGPAFLDLQDISGIGMGQGSVLLAVLYIGYMAGAVVGGVILYNRFKRCLQFTINNLLLCGILLAVPWCSVYELMITAFFGFGATIGFTDTVANAEIINLWGQESKALVQALHCAFSVGISISPLTTMPFLSKPTNNIPSKLHHSGRYNETSLNATMTSQKMLFNSTIDDITKQTSKLYFAYLITAVVAFLASSVFFIFYIIYDRSDSSSSVTHQTDLIKEKERKLPLMLTVCSLINMTALLGLLCGIDDTFLSFLAAFCVKYLHWARTEGSLLTSVSNMFLVVGRFVGIFLITCIRPMKLAGMHFVGVFIVFIGLLFSALYFSDVGTWVCALLYGYAKSVIFGCIFTWTNETFLSVSGKISSLFFVVITTNTIVNPLILASLMESYSNIWFCYLFLGESVLLIVLFISAVVLSNYVEKNYGRTCDDFHVDNETQSDKLMTPKTTCAKKEVGRFVV